MLQFLVENPLCCFGAIVVLFPGILPVTLAFIIGRRYEVRSPFQRRGGGGSGDLGI